MISEMGNVIEPMSHVDRNCTTDYEMDGPRLALCVLEMTINAVVLASSVLFGKLLSNITTFSATMKALFLNMLFAAIGIAATRLFILIPQYIAINELYDASFVAPIQVFHDVCINVNTLITMAITLECLIYSFRPDPKKSTTIILCSLNTFWPWFTTIAMYWMEQRGFIETVPQFVVLEVFNLLSWAIFLRLYFYNRKRYKMIGASSLDEKYQITVKIRVLRTLLFLAVLTTVRNFLTMTLLIIIIGYVQPQCLYYVHLYCNHTYDITVALYSLLFILPLIVSNNEFQKQFKKFVFGTRKPSAMPSIAITSARQEPLRNALGETLIVTNNASEYYRQLAESWNRIPGGSNNWTARRRKSHPRNKAKMATLKVRDLLAWKRAKISNGAQADLAGQQHRRHSFVERRNSRMVNVETPSDLTPGQRCAPPRRATTPMLTSLPKNVVTLGSTKT